MNILAINSSPRTGDRSKTELMLTHLVSGMRHADAQVEVVNLKDKRIKSCIGCFTCWTKTPGRCFHKDHMTEEIFPKWLESDLVIYASPLYYHSMNGAMSTFMERTLPAIQPFFEKGDDGKIFHPLRFPIPKAVWLSVCGFPDESEFEALSYHLNHTRHPDVALVAEIYRPAAESLGNPFVKERSNDVLRATEEAGVELVRNLNISPETMARIRQPLEDAESFALTGNLFWKTCIAEGVTPKEFQQKKMVPRPDSMETFLRIFPHGLNANAVREQSVALQFHFSGEVEGACYFRIQMGRVDAFEGIFEDSNITIDTPFDLWMDIMTGKLDGQRMFMEQKYKVQGDIPLMMRLFEKNDSAR